MGSDLDLGAHQFRELADDGGVSRPCRSRDEVAVHYRFGSVHRHEGAAGQCDIGSHGGIGGGFVAFQHARCRQDLRTVADGRHRFAGSEEFPDDLQDPLVEADVFRSSAADYKIPLNSLKKRFHPITPKHNPGR